MTYLLLLLTLSITIPSAMQKIYTFSPQTNTREWRIVNDGVMGGISTSSLALTGEGHGQFSGHVSLANYGGFASMQLDTSIQVGAEKQWIVLRIKGDGRRYEFRLKGRVSEAESYVHPFTTSGAWETIRLPLRDFYPQFRGRKLNSPNFNFPHIEQLIFLIANKQEEDFALLIDWIGLE